MVGEDKVMPVLVTADVAASVAFYRDVLGFDEGTPYGDTGGEHFTSMTYGSTTLALATAEAFPEAPPARGLSFLILAVPQAAAIQRVIAGRDDAQRVGPLHTTPWGDYFDVTDPAGHLVRFFERSAATRRPSETAG